MQIIAIIASGDTTTCIRSNVAYSTEKTISVACIKLPMSHSYLLSVETGKLWKSVFSVN